MTGRRDVFRSVRPGRSTLTLSYWRTKSEVEVDFVVYGKDGFRAIEVKNGRRIAG